MPLPFIPFKDVYNQGERNFQKFYLQKANLQDLSLREIDLSGADLTGANLQGADLSGSNLKGALLAGANLKQSQLQRADLSEADLTGADLEGANLAGAALSRAVLRRASLNFANLSQARLVEVDGRGVVEASPDHGAVVHRTSFLGAVIRDANLSDADFRWGIFQGADLSGARLLRADLSDIDATCGKMPSGSRNTLLMAGADLTLVSLRKSQIVGDFQTASLSQADLREAAIVGNFQEADLSDALLWNTVLTGSNFTNSTLSGVYLEGSKLNKCLMPNGKPPRWDLEKFSGKPPTPSAKGVIRRKPTYTEFWFEEFEKVQALHWPAMCVCCCRTLDRYERLTCSVAKTGYASSYEIQVPFCTACLQHHIRSRNVENWMKTMCTAQGGDTPAVKFGIKTRGMLAGKQYFVLSFSSMEYTISFAARNQLPVHGNKKFS
jgi:uncharacterized protein YjbI with pentapeptide repeats